MSEQPELDPKLALIAVMAEAKLHFDFEFVPLSKSRNAVVKLKSASGSDLSLNWKATLKQYDRVVMVTDYMQGIANAPSYKASIKELGGRNSVMRFEALSYEAEFGKQYRAAFLGVVCKLEPPNGADVMGCLLLDASAIDSPSFEDWASDYGYDSDSRKAEAMYRVCLGVGLKLRAALGSPRFDEMQNLARQL